MTVVLLLCMYNVCAGSTAPSYSYRDSYYIAIAVTVTTA